MALKLNRGKPAHRLIGIGGGVSLKLRPATYAESMQAAERIVPLIVALREGSAAAAEVGAMLGEEFAEAQWDDAALNTAATKLALMELIALCCEGIDGKLLDADGVEITTIDAAIAGLLLREPPMARLLRAVIEGPLHEVLEEKKELAASLNGGAATLGTVLDAAPPEPPAP